MNILSIDPATKCGFAHSTGISGTWDLSIRRDESAGMRLIRLRGKLQEILAALGVELLVFEAARNCASSMQGALVVQSEIQSVIKVWCEDNKVEYRGYSPTEIKKHATGKGNAKKADMVESALRKWPDMDRNADDNECDAKWLLDFAVSSMKIQT
jgi:Holliday junction resolvasome RuvABC endonuclease subunit